MTEKSNDGNKNIVIIGHGMSGFKTVQELLNLKANDMYKIIVIDSRTFYEQDIMSTAFLTWAGEESYNNAHSFPDWKLKQAGVHEYITDTVVSVEKNEKNNLLQVKLNNATGRNLTAVAIVCATGFTVPVLKPSIGAKWDARKDKMKKYRDAMKSAKNVLIGGGGSTAITMAGDARLFCDVENGAKIHIVMSEDTVLNDNYGQDDRKRVTTFIEKSKGVILHKNDRMVHDDFDQPSCEKNRKYILKSGKEINADVYLPCFAKWVAGNYLNNISGATKANGLVVVNHETLQSTVDPRIFAVGCSDLMEKEGWNGIPKIIPNSSTIHPTAVYRYWDEGIYDPVNRDIPLMLRDRITPVDQDRLKKMVLRFGTGMSGQVLTTLPSRPYSYSQKLTLDLYAYSMKFSNRLLGYICMPGAPNMAPVNGAGTTMCPFCLNNTSMKGGLHAVTLIYGVMGIKHCADNDFTHRYTDMHSLWNEQLNLFLQHMTSTGNNGASYFFVDVHVSAGSINSVKAAAATKHRKYREAWTRFCRDRPNDDAILTQYQQINHSTMGRPEVVTFGVNYDGAFDDNAIKFMARLAEIKYPTNPNNRSYRVSRQRWIVHYARQIQLAVANGAAPAISLAIRNIKSQL
eukprot:g3241.t1